MNCQMTPHTVTSCPHDNYHGCLMSYVGLIGAFDILYAHTCLWYGQEQTAGVYITGISAIGQIKAVTMTRLPM